MTLIDTDILIDVSRGIQEATNCLKTIQVQSTLAISVVTEMELLVGCRNKGEVQQLDSFLKRF